MKRLMGVVRGSLLALVGMWSFANAATVYRVRLNTSEFAGTPRRLTLDWVSPGTPANFARIAAFTTNGTRGPSIFQGGPVSGGLIDGVGPIMATLQDQSFYNQLVIPLTPAGGLVLFDVGTSENVVAGETALEELSFYLLNPDDSFAFPTVDPIGANALFAIDVTGQSGGDLSVFSPLQFVAPDSLVMNNSTVEVTPRQHQHGRLRFRAAIPNPSLGGVRFVYEVPEPGGVLRVRIFDVAGRLVAEPFGGERAAGVWTTRWDAVDSKGRVVAAGVYIVQLQLAGQSLVRRVVLTR